MTDERGILVEVLKQARPNSREELAAAQALDRYDREHPRPKWKKRHGGIPLGFTPKGFAKPS